MQHASNRNKPRRNGDAPASRQLTLEDWVQMLEEDADLACDTVRPEPSAPGSAAIARETRADGEHRPGEHVSGPISDSHRHTAAMSPPEQTEARGNPGAAAHPVVDCNELQHAYLVVEDVAQRLRCSKRTVHELTRTLAIPHRRLPGCRRCLFREDELEAWEGGAPLEVLEQPGGGRIVRPSVAPTPIAKAA